MEINYLCRAMVVGVEELGKRRQVGIYLSVSHSRSNLRLLLVQSVSCFGIGSFSEWDLVADNNDYS